MFSANWGLGPTSMVNYRPTAVTSKVGVNIVRALTEQAGSLFHKIEHENDLGIDAILEIIISGRPVGVQVGVQSSQAAHTSTSAPDTCVIPIDNHAEYWSRYPLPL